MLLLAARGVPLTRARGTSQVSYVTQDTVTDTQVRYGKSATALTSTVSGTSESFEAGVGHTYVGAQYGHHRFEMLP